MTAFATTSNNSGALFTLDGTVANNATWQENITFLQEGSPLLLTGLDFKMTFRNAPGNSSADLTLSTDAGTLSIETDTDSGIDCILYINASASVLSSLVGDYVCDLASQDASNVVTLWAHGTVSFRPNPVSF